MKSKISGSLILLITLVFVSGVNAQSGAARGKGHQKGVVTDTEGNPVEGVTVHLENPQIGAGFDLKTNAKGQWVAGGVHGGTWNIDFTKEGYVTKKISAYIKELEFNKSIDISLEKQVVVPTQQEVPGLKQVREGNQLRENKDWAGAIAKYEEAAGLNPAFYTVYGDIGSIYLDMNQPDKAIEAFNKFLEKEPENPEVRAYAASAWLAKGNTAEAKKILADINPESLTDEAVLYNLGASFYNARQTAEAIRYWERVVAINPQNVDAQLQLGLAYYSTKQTDQAKLAFQKVIELAPGSDNAKSAQEMLDTMK